MFHVRDNFKNLVGKAAAREFNKIAAFLNNLCAGDFMHVERPDVPTSDTPPRIALRYDALMSRFGHAEREAGNPANGYPRGGLTVDANQVALDNTDAWSAGSGNGLRLLAIAGVDGSSTAQYRRLVLRELTLDTEGRALVLGREVGFIRFRNT